MFKGQEDKLNNLTPDPLFVYNGSKKTEGPLPSDVMMRKNKSTSNQRPSILKLGLIIIFCTSLGLLVINNILTINSLVKEIDTLSKTYRTIKSTNEFLIAEVNKKSTYERIVPLAQQELSMFIQKTPPEWFELSNENNK